MELPLPSGGACLLGALNLSKIFDKEFFSHTRAGQSELAVERMADYVSKSVRYLNEVLEESIPLNPLPEQKKSAEKYRPIGLGIMGLADVFINAGVKYGSKESIEICHMIGYTMAWNALKTSCELAKELGKFKACKVTYILKSEFIKENVINNPYYSESEKEELLADIKKYGLRNAQLLTIAPTGTTSTILNVSGGIEPMFSTHYTRTTKTVDENGDKTYEVYPRVVEEYFKDHPEIDNDINKLPEYFITSRYVTPKERIDVQAAWQMHIDNSISGTVNLPETATVEDVKNLYIYGHEAGLKGITVFRENCRRAAILNDMNNKETKKENNEIKKVSREYIGIQTANSEDELKGERWIEFADGCNVYSYGEYFYIANIIEYDDNTKDISDIKKYAKNKKKNELTYLKQIENDTNCADDATTSRDDCNHCNEAQVSNNPNHMVTRTELGRRLDASVYYVRIGCGHMYIIVSRDKNNKPVEVFMNSSKSGGCSANAESLGRYASACLRSNMDVNDIVDITRGVKCPACTSLKGKGYEIDGLSCGDAMAKVIKEEVERLKELESKEYKHDGFCNCAKNINLSDLCLVDDTPKISKSELTKETVNHQDDKWNYKEHSFDENIAMGICPECGSNLQRTEGCLKCLCGFSKC